MSQSRRTPRTGRRSVLAWFRSRAFPALICTSLLVVPSFGHSASEDEDPTAELLELQSIMFAFADKYMSAIAQVTGEIREQNPADPDLRLRMHTLKLVVTAGIQELALSSNPESTLLDMMVFAALHRMVYEGDAARDFYGDGIDEIGKSMRMLEQEIWAVASRYLSGEQLAEVRRMVREWRTSHPDFFIVSYVRFHDFASLRSKSPLVEQARKGGLFVDTSGAEKAVDKAVLLAERAMHYAQRLPWIIEWQAENVFYQLLVQPEIRDSLERTRALSHTLDRFADALETLPNQINAERQATVDHLSEALAAQRVAFFSELDVRQDTLEGTIVQVRAGLADADKLAVSLESTTSRVNEALINADKLMARFDRGSGAATAPSKPFDINAYAAAIKELTVALQEANTLVLSTERLTGGEGMMSRVYDRALWTGTILILILCVAVFITMLIYRAAARHIVPRSSFEYVGPPTERKEQ